MQKRYFTFFLAMVFCAAQYPASAADVENRTNYTIALAGLPLANATFRTRKGESDYSIDAQIASAGVARLIVDTKAEMSSVGVISDSEFKPERFSFRYKYGKRIRQFHTTFAGGNVTETLMEPKQKKRKNWIPIRPQDLLSVTDPVSGLVMPADRDPCRAIIPVYDGEARLNLKLAHKREQKFQTEGFKGEAIVCSLRYEPKAGYRRGHGDIEYIRKLTNMEIWFAKSGPMNVYAPVFLSVPTKYGTLTIRATRFEG
ncbi:DUF3108 domain-containing protein [Rhizobium sp. KVB221]|uniref:DUF3108 domain-containing protein n=1 Tax=Rhizobium setariae TaxID=2801340 RepID=A0A936YU80_9HYPH|nr:DUF3108 domain-containing protein [Rhizobium setariae]MBL0372645.1 DUF3108 domain-containing protein [Rhizobium setariae]